MEVCSHEQLIGIFTENFKLDVSDKRMKEIIRNIVRANLSDLGLIGPTAQVSTPEMDSVGAYGFGDFNFFF